MSWINKLHYLQLLRLEANGVTDKGLVQLDSLPYIENLSLSNTAITDKGLSALSNFPRLRFLGLRGTDISDGAVDMIAKCPRLEKVELGMTNVTANGIQSLQQKNPNCKIEQYNREAFEPFRSALFIGAVSMKLGFVSAILGDLSRDDVFALAAAVGCRLRFLHGQEEQIILRT